jgi:putative ABC transport system permease protein
MSINFLESARLAIKTLIANKLRAFLTMVGISIGVGAVIALLAIGVGVQNYIAEQFTSAGTNLVGVTPGRAQRGGPPGGFGNQTVLTVNDYKAIAASVPHLENTAAEFSAIGNFVYEGATTQVQVNGALPAFSELRNWPTSLGRFIDEADNGGRSRVVVLGGTAAKDLFPEEDPLDKVVKINNVPFRVIGVMQSKGSSFLGDQDAVAFVPLATAQERLFQRQAQSRTGERSVSTIYLQVTDEKDRPAMQVALRDLLRERHKLKEGDEDDFTITSQTQLLDTFGQVTGALTIFLGAIAAISLLVGGIGIMNIMLVSVTERTREIGLRKAIGAKSRVILGQFLTEAIVLSLIGGVIGILLGSAIALAIGYFTDFKPVIQLQAIALAVGFSMAVGLFFGIYPARRASLLNPIDALRYE